MNKNTVASVFLLAVLVICSNSLSAATVSIGNYFSSNNSITIPVFISGGEEIKDMGALIVVGDGGTLIGSSPVPTVTAIDYSGSIWEGAPNGFISSLATALPQEIAFPSVSLNTIGESVTAAGTLLNFTLDLTGFPNGSTYGLSMQFPSFQDTQFSLVDGSMITPTYVNGSITIIPEPSSIILAVVSLGAFCLFFARIVASN